MVLPFIDAAVTSMSDAMSSSQILVSLPLNDGKVATVDLEPQEASFREFASKCLAAFPPMPQPEDIPPPAKTAKDYAQQGDLYVTQKDYYNAIGSYESAVALDKNNRQFKADLERAHTLERSFLETPGPRMIYPNRPALRGVYVVSTANRMWMTQDNGEDVDLREASQYCRESFAGAYSDWRLPSVDELAQIRYIRPQIRSTVPSKTELRLDDSAKIRIYPVGSTWHYDVAPQITLTGPAFWTLSPGKTPDHQLTFLGFIGYGNEERLSSTKAGLRALCTRGALAAPLIPATPNIQPGAQPDGFVPRRSDNAARRTYSGPLSGFDNALTNVIYASFNKVALAPYRKDIFAINNYAHNCATLTPAIAAEISAEGHGQSTTPTAAGNLAGKYSICYSGSSAHQDEIFSADTGRPWNKPEGSANLRQILVDISSSDNWTGASGDPSQTHTFVVRVWATRLDYDPPLPKSSATGIRSELWPVMEATIVP